MERIVSIIMPTYNEERFIEQSIQSMLAQDFPTEQWELLIIDGMSTDKTRELLKPYIERYSYIRLLENPRHTAPCAMNIGIREAKGEYICRIDAHSVFPVNYISALLHYTQELPDASNVGCVCKTLPANDSPQARAIAIACSHPFGVGNNTFRTATIDSITETDTVPFGFWRKTLFERIGMFDEELIRNQDDEFNARTIQHGGHIYLVPGISTIYYSRDSISKTAQMFYQYGLFKPLVNHKLKHPATLRQFIPLLFVIGLIIGLPLIFLSKVILYIYIGCIAIYIIGTGLISMQYKNCYLPLVFFTIHWSYGWGYLCGMIKLICKQSFQVNTNR